MYQVQNTPDPHAILGNGSEVTPLITLKDEHGGVAHIIDDDHCLVLILEYADGTFAGLCRMVSHWFPEATQALAAYLSQRNHEQADDLERYHVDKYWIDDDPASWDQIRTGELFMIRGRPFGHPEREGVVYRKCSSEAGQDSMGNQVYFDPGGMYTTLKPKCNKLSLDEQAACLEKELSAALHKFPASCSSGCTAPMTVKTFGDSLDRLVIGIKEHFYDSGAKEGLLGKVTVKPNHNREVDKAFFAQVTFLVPREDSIRNRPHPWTRLLEHRSNPINEAIEVLRLDAPGTAGAHFDYAILAGVWPMSDMVTPAEFMTKELNDPDRRRVPVYENSRVRIYLVEQSTPAKSYYLVAGYDREGEVTDLIVANQVSFLQFQNGGLSDVGNNGITHEALLAVLIDRMRGMQSGPFSCRENACTLTKLEEALMWQNKRTQKRKLRGVEGSVVP